MKVRRSEDTLKITLATLFLGLLLSTQTAFADVYVPVPTSGDLNAPTTVAQSR